MEGDKKMKEAKKPERPKGKFRCQLGHVVNSSTLRWSEDQGEYVCGFSRGSLSCRFSVRKYDSKEPKKSKPV